jgi:hypothetical protein
MEPAMENPEVWVVTVTSERYGDHEYNVLGVGSNPEAGKAIAEGHSLPWHSPSKLSWRSQSRTDLSPQYLAEIDREDLDGMPSATYTVECWPVRINP